MINWNMISKIMGALLFFEAALMSLSLGISIYSGEGDTPAFVTSVGLILLAAIVFRYFGLKAGNRLSRKDAYMVVTLSGGLQPLWLAAVHAERICQQLHRRVL